MTKTVEINGVAYEIGNSRSLIDVDRDMRWHGGDSPSESWFLVASLTSEGDKIGLQAHVLLNDIPRRGKIVSINLSLINETTGWYKAAEYVYSNNEVAFSTEAFNIQARDFSFSGDDETIATYAAIEGATIDIRSKRRAPALLTNGEGYVEVLGAAQYEYAFPRMETTGQIAIEGKAYEVSGTSWLDRQWGGLPDYFAGHADDQNSYSSMQWLWVNPQLDNGINMSIGHIKEFDKKRLTTAATCVKPDGTHVVTVIEPVEEIEHWVSPTTGNKYPTKVVLRAPSIDCVLTVEVPYKAQEIVSTVGGVTKYEGAAIVTGTFEGEKVSGECYLELVGYWR